MRRLAVIVLLATAAFLFGNADRAFAHAAHFHFQKTQAAPVAKKQAGTKSAARESDSFFVSATPTEKGPANPESANCPLCCASAGGVSADLPAPAGLSRDFVKGQAHRWRSEPHAVRQAVFDLNRPPKFFA